MKLKLLLIIISLILILGNFPPVPVSAAEPAVWRLVETIFVPESGNLQSRDKNHTWSLEGDSMHHRFTFSGPQTVDNHQKFVFTWPGEILKPGDTVTLKVVGTSEGSNHTISGEMFEYSAEGITLEGRKRVSLGFAYGKGPEEAKPSFVVPAISAKTFTIAASMLSAAGESPAGFKVQWVYRAMKIEKMELDLKFSAPLVYLEPGWGADVGFAGELAATLKDEDGKGIKGKTIIFFIEKEFPARDQTGKNLFDVLAYESRPMGRAGALNVIEEVHPFLKKGIPGPGVLNPALDKALINEDRIFLGPGIVTNSNGEAIINVIDYGIIDPRKLSSELISQSMTFTGKGKVSGKIIAGVYNEETKFVEHQTSLEIEYPAMAKIIRITGEGRSEEFKRSFIQEYPEDAPWGPGRVRVRRAVALPHFDYQEAFEGFLLMPGDILDIDSGVAVEIVWATGDRVIARIPAKHEASTSRERHEHGRLIMLSSAYDSGFQTDIQKMLESATFGFGAERGFEILVESIPYVGKILKEGGELAIAMVEGLKDTDWKKIDIFTRMRIRSRVIIDDSDEALKVYNLQGSPDIQTEAGDEITLPEGKMVAISGAGVMSNVGSFDIDKAEEEHFSSVPAITPGKTTEAVSATAVRQPSQVSLPKATLSRQSGKGIPKSGTSSTKWYLIAGGVAFVCLVGLLIWRRKSGK